MKQKKKLRALALIALALAALACVSCNRQKTAGALRAAGELRFGFTTEPATLDPLSPANTADGRSILFNVFEGLVKPDTEGKLQLRAAQMANITEYGRVYSFVLRDQICFHDGSLLTSADVRFTLETAMAAGFAGFDSIEKIDTPTDHDIRITLKQPDPEFLPYLTIGIVKAGSADRDKKAVGTGPFYIESYTVQQSLVLKKFEDYHYGPPAQLDKVTIVFFADADALVLGLQGGTIDGAGLPGALAHQLDPEHFDIVPGYSAMVQLLALNNAVPPLNDIWVRKAINYGIDIQEIINAAFYGEGRPSGSPLIPGLAVYYENTLADPYPLDRERAQALLSGYQLSLEITVPSVYTMHVDTAQVIAEQLAKIGINASIKLVDWATWLSDVYFGRNYQATIISLDALHVSPKSFLYRYYSDNDSNFINYKSAGFDRVYNAILAEVDEEKRIALYKEAQRIISNDAASVYIQDIMGFTALRAGLFGGVQTYPLYVMDFASIYERE